MIHWALTAAAVLALLYAIRILFSSAKQRNAAKQRLGFGFSIAAAGLWIYVLRHHFGELGLAVRISGGVLLSLPAVSALASPARANILRALLGLFLAVLVAGPAVQELWRKYGPDTRPQRVQVLQDRLDEVHSIATGLSERRDALVTLRNETTAEIKALGGGWEEVQNNPIAIKKLELLSAIRTDLTKIERTLDELNLQEALLTSSLELDNTSPDLPQLQNGSELQSLKRELEGQAQSEDASIVEQHLRTQKLRDLYEEELGDD